MRDSNRAIARHLHQAVYRDRHRDIWSPNGALTGAYSTTGTRKPARTYRKMPQAVETMRRQRSRPGSRSTGEAAGTSGDLRPATRRDIAPHRATSKTGGGTVGQCTRDSNRAIARHCETVRYSPDRGPGRIRAISGLVTPPAGEGDAKRRTPDPGEPNHNEPYRDPRTGA